MQLITFIYWEYSVIILVNIIMRFFSARQWKKGDFIISFRSWDNREPGGIPGRSGHCNQSSHLRIPLYEKALCLMYEKVQNKDIYGDYLRVSVGFLGIWTVSQETC